MSRPEVVLVLGAGATVGGGFQVRYKGTIWKPPMDFKFFETPVVQGILTGTDNYPVLNYYRQGNSLEANWAKVDLYYKLCNRGLITEEEAFKLLKSGMEKSAVPGYAKKLGTETSCLAVPSMALWELRALLLEVYRNLKHRRRRQSPLFRLIRNLMDKKLLKGIITFNYDTSVEYCFGPIFFYPSLPNQDSKKLPLMKLHGSLNWQADSHSNPHISVMKPITKLAEIDHDGKKWKQPEVIGPTFFKQEITFDIEAKRDFRAPVYKDLWKFAWQRLKTATHLVFVGFSFPQTDFHAAALFRTAHLSGSGFRRVILCHFRDSNLRRTAEQVFAGKMTELTEFPDGLQDMASRVDELVGLLSA